MVTLKGSTSESYVKSDVPEAELVLADSYDEALQKLESDEVSILVADYPYCVYTSMGYPKKNLIPHDQPLTIEAIGMVLPPNDAQMHNLGKINYLCLF